MSWSGRRLRARIAEIRRDGAEWEPRPDEPPPPETLGDLARRFRRSRAMGGGEPGGEEPREGAAAAADPRDPSVEDRSSDSPAPEPPWGPMAERDAPDPGAPVRGGADRSAPAADPLDRGTPERCPRDVGLASDRSSGRRVEPPIDPPRSDRAAPDGHAGRDSHGETSSAPASDAGASGASIGSRRRTRDAELAKQSSSRHRRARRGLSVESTHEWGGASGASPANDRTVHGATYVPSDRRLERDGPLWSLEECIVPGESTSDHFAPEFSLEPYRREVADEGAPLPPMDRLIFFDLETTGLASHDLLFMSGCLWFEGETLVLRQEIAEDVADERELVARLRERLTERGAIVTYNGRSFDVPALDRRLAFHGLPKLDRDALEVYDLLHLARRRFKGELPNCKLSTLEREVICKERAGQDVPGLEVPLRFLDFLESGEFRHLDPVLYHNRIDLTTLVALFPRLLEPIEADAPPAEGRGPETADGV